MGNEQSGQDAERKSSSSKKNNKQEKSDVFHYSNVTGVTHRALSRSSPNNKNRYQQQNNEDGELSEEQKNTIKSKNIEDRISLHWLRKITRILKLFLALLDIFREEEKNTYR